MKQFKLLNSIFGWIVFAVASATYLLTIEPTASFWDCGEFIATSYKLEVGHPPGNSFFELMAKFFTLFAGNDVTRVAVCVNIMSALVSAFTILLLFWSITHLSRKIVFKNDNYSLGATIAVIGAGLVGALAYTFSDSFWFSAVEAEVYASSSFYTALVFWVILKWEDRASDKHSDRWLILIAYLMGLSIGVHLLNLLAIPAIVFVYYFKKYPVTTKGLVYTSIIAVALLGSVMYGVIQGLIYGAAYMDLMFVNGFGLPFFSGVFFFVTAIIVFIVWALMYTYKKRKVLLNTILLIFTVIILGYSSVVIIVIRSQANTPLDENDPENMFSLLYYLNREQYGDRPLLFGPVYNAPAIDYKEDGKPTYTPINGKYEITNHRPEYVYDDRFITIFPRVWSPDPDHIKGYQQWANIKGEPIDVSDRNTGKSQTIYKPTFGENLKFFFVYQINHMYIRYFMWNFAGRQNDIQGHGEITKGNWLSGIKGLDEARLGPQDKLPDSMAKNKGRNTYYLLPLLLGLLGIIYQYIYNKRDFSVLLMMFFFMGLAIVIYLNQKPFEPRERDYAYVGSFYVFAMWIGLGVLGLYDLLSNKMPAIVRSVAITIVCLLLVPGIMAKENWDDHDRSNRYTARDFASNYLESCDTNGIIFTNGDNDTFPLWYCQEVENIRTDVRVVNLSYLSADWYIGQMHEKCYESDPVPFSLTREKVRQGKRDVVYLFDQIKTAVPLKDAIDFVASDDPQTKQLGNYTSRIDYIPAKKFKLDVDTAALFNSGYLSRKYAKQVVPRMEWSINKTYITKSDLMILDLLANNNWKRPVYFAITVARENYCNLDEYLQINGLTYKIVPIKNDASAGDIMNINTDLVYNRIMNKFRWGGINNPKVYLDENNMRMLSNFRNNFAKLAEALIAENKRDSALKVLDKGMEVTPDKCIAYNYFSLPFIDLYYRLNKPEIAKGIAKKLGESTEADLNYYYRLSVKNRELIDNDIRIGLQVLRQLSMIVNQYGEKELFQQYDDAFKRFYSLYTSGS